MSFTRKLTFPPQPATTRGQAVHLGGDPKGENFLYTNGRSVIIRNLANPELAKEYTGHSAPATVARYSPSGYYIASGDAHGNIRIWDTTQAENILKIELKLLSGKISDIAWDHESKRLIAAGDGKDRCAAAILFDSGSSVGEISGHSKIINSVSLRQARPFRAATASDDMTVNFYHGVPYKYNKTISDHTRFVQCVRFSPSGDHFLTAGMDGKIFLYDGKTADKVCELSAAENSHSGGIFSVSWSPDGTQLLTGSADTTVKLWDVQAQKVVTTWSLAPSTPPSFEYQQVGTLWQNQHLLSLGLSGDFTYFSPTSPTPTRVVQGHQRAITALALDPSTKTLFSGSYDGRVCAWSLSEGGDKLAKPITGGHKNQVSSLAVDDGKVVSVGWDDTLRGFEVGNTEFIPSSIATAAQPTSVSARSGITVAVTKADEVLVLIAGAATPVATKLGFTPTAVALSPDTKEVAVGGDDAKVRLFSLTGTTLTPTHTLENNQGAITALSYSPDATLLAAADAQRSIIVYDTATKAAKISQWMFHSARVTSIAWSPDSLHAASGSLDTNVEIWSVAKPLKHVAIKGAHLEAVNGVAWVDNSTVASAGQDASIKVWSITHIA